MKSAKSQSVLVTNKKSLMRNSHIDSSNYKNTLKQRINLQADNSIRGKEKDQQRGKAFSKGRMNNQQNSKERILNEKRTNIHSDNIDEQPITNQGVLRDEYNHKNHPNTPYTSISKPHPSLPFLPVRSILSIDPSNQTKLDTLIAKLEMSLNFDTNTVVHQLNGLLDFLDDERSQYRRWIIEVRENKGQNNGRGAQNFSPNGSQTIDANKQLIQRHKLELEQKNKQYQHKCLQLTQKLTKYESNYGNLLIKYKQLKIKFKSQKQVLKNIEENKCHSIRKQSKNIQQPIGRQSQEQNQCDCNNEDRKQTNKPLLRLYSTKLANKGTQFDQFLLQGRAHKGSKYGFQQRQSPVSNNGVKRAIKHNDVSQNRHRQYSNQQHYIAQLEHKLTHYKTQTLRAQMQLDKRQYNSNQYGDINTLYEVRQSQEQHEERDIEDTLTRRQPQGLFELPKSIASIVRRQEALKEIQAIIGQHRNIINTISS